MNIFLSAYYDYYISYIILIDYGEGVRRFKQWIELAESFRNTGI